MTANAATETPLAAMDGQSLFYSLASDKYLHKSAAQARTLLGVTQPALVAASNAPQTWLNVANYVCTGTSDQTTINSALATHKVVVLSPGTFSIGLAAHPVNANYQVGVILNDQNSLIGSGKATVLQLAANQASSSASVTASVIYNNQIGAGGDSNLTISDLLLDGNNLNQGTAVQGGIGVLRARSVYHTRVRAINFRGTASSGFAETFFFESGLSTDIFYINCEAIGTAGSTATGFSADQGTSIHYVDCVGRGMTVAHGFTHNTCGLVTYSGCHSYSNTLNGFNSEVSHDVLYQNCISGGTASAGTSFPYTANQSLGNSNAGWNVVTGVRVRAVNCVGNNNVFGFYSTGGTNNEVLGGVYTANTNGVQVDAGTRVTGGTYLGGNTTNLLTPNGNFAGEGAVANPAVPATTVAYTNQFGLDATVYVAGGTVSAVAVGGNATGLTSGAFRVPAGATITLTYTVAPTWNWILG